MEVIDEGTKQLISELKEIHRRVAELKALENERKRTEKKARRVEPLREFGCLRSELLVIWSSLSVLIN